MRSQQKLHCGKLAACVLVLGTFLLCYASAQEQPSPRWGQASALAGSHFIIHGGHTNAGTGGGYSFTTGPTTAEMLMLDMSRSFSTTAAPWKTFDASQGAPAVAFHTITALQGGSRLLAFGGEASTSDATPDDSDSAYVAQISSDAQSATWTRANPAWKQPSRRIFHSSDCDGTGKLWFVGGEKADGSSIEDDEAWTIDTNNTNAQFSALPQPSAGLVGATLTYLEDQRLALLGGLGPDAKLTSFESVANFDTATGRWQTIKAVAGPAGFPAPRRNHVAVILPQKRILIHGGGDGALLTAMNDMWILDWSQDPPRWSQLSDSTAGGPGARFGHSAVAYGSKIAVAFGWDGNNAADSQLYIFDASQLAVASDGSLSGGQWLTTYTPDAVQLPTASNNAASQSESADDGASESSTSAASSNPQTASGSGTDGFNDSHDDGNDNGSSTGTKAGMVVGCFLGLSALAGAGYYAYRRKLRASHDWNEDGGAIGLLHNEKPRKDFAAASADEKDLESGHVLHGREGNGRPWSAANVTSHAYDAAGPHIGQRLALMTGLSRAPYRQSHRFDMLADEDETRDYEASLFGTPFEEAGNAMELPETMYRMHAGTSRSELVDRDGHARQQSAVALVEDYADTSAALQLDLDSTLPPSDEMDSFAGTVSDAHASYHNSAPRSSRQRAESVDDEGDVSSLIAGSYAGDAMSRAGSRRASIISFSNSPTATRRQQLSDIGLGVPRLDDSSPLIRRSPTWWQRFMNQSFLERTASGRLSAGPNAVQPIRDPAEPPQLGVIRERSSHSASDGLDTDSRSATRNPFDEPDGRQRVLAALHDRSRSSLQTATSSVLEDRIRYMDVVQRVGSTSTRRSASAGPSEYSDIRAGRHTQQARRSHRSSHTEANWESIEEATDMQPTMRYSEDPFQDVIAMADNLREMSKSRDIADTTLQSVEHTPDDDSDEDVRAYLSQCSDEADSDDEGGEHYEHARLGVLPQRRQVSEALSVTPSTTKRARKNAKVINPFSPEPTRTKPSVLRGSVQDRVRAIERKWSEEGEEAVLPLPRSQSSRDSLVSLDLSQARRPVSGLPYDASHFVPGRGGRPIPTRHERTRATTLTAVQTAPTPPSSTTRYSHGLAPKPQLFIANPDHRLNNSSG